MRIFHYDIARGCYLRPREFKKAMTLAQKSGFDHFLPYLENMIRLPSIEKACPARAVTPEQWREYENHGRAVGIELMAHFNVIGHTTDICRAYPELGDGELDVETDAAKRWTLECLGEYLRFHTGKYMLIGGDEWQPPRARLEFAFQPPHGGAGQREIRGRPGKALLGLQTQIHIFARQEQELPHQFVALVFQ